MRIPKKVCIPVVVIAALVGAYAIAGFWWAPRYIRAEFTRFVAQDLKKQPRLGEVKVNPFTLRASIADLGIHEPSGERIVGFSRLDLDLSIRSVWTRGPGVRRHHHRTAVRVGGGAQRPHAEPRGARAA